MKVRVLLGLGLSMLILGLASSVIAGVSSFAALFPIGATLLFIASILAGGLNVGGARGGSTVRARR